MREGSGRAGSCTACGEPAPEPFYALQGIPVQSCVLLESRAEARAYPTADLELLVCSRCGFIANPLFSESVQGEMDAYEASQAGSGRFQEFLRAQCDELMRRHDLAGRRVLEIGCGGGDFLLELCARTGGEGLGFDPTYPPERPDSVGAVAFRRERYDAAQFAERADLIACRHTLEHIAEPRAFVSMVAEASRRQDCPVFFEVPDVRRILADRAFWDVYYEHCNYFSAHSLRGLFERCGFTVEALDRVYDDQYLVLTARAGDGPPPRAAAEPAAEATQAVRAARDFGAAMEATLERWRTDLAGHSARGERVVLWGAGSKAAGFLATLGTEAAGIERIVDINERKQGHFQAGGGQEIVAPSALLREPPDLVIIMNAVYRDEIARDLAKMGLRPEIRAL